MRRARFAFLLLSTLLAACAGGSPATPSVSAVPSASPSAVGSASASGAPSPTGSASGAPSATPPTAGTILTIEIPGTAYVRLDESEGGSVTRDGDALVIETVRSSGMSTRIGYDLPAGSIPLGTTLARIDVKVCGAASGDFWETYAPSGGEPLELEVAQPAADGCWHFDGAADGDPYFESFVSGDSRMRIERVVYTVTAA